MLAPTFNRESGFPGMSLFWLMVWAVAIDDGRQKREKERRRETNLQRQEQLQSELRRRLPAPRPC